MKGGVPAMSLEAPKFLCIDSAKEASNDANNFFKLRFIKKQKPVHAIELKVKEVSLNVPDFL